MSMTLDYTDIKKRGILGDQFNADRDDGYAADDSAPFGYWRKPNGYITWGQYGPNGLPKSLRGWTPLASYGQRPQSGGAGAWKPEFDPYLMIIARGGLHEFPVEQVIELGWHRKPRHQAHASHRLVWEDIERSISAGVDRDDAIRSVLTQFVGRDIPEDITCEFCPDKVFSTAADVRNHEAVAHKDDVRQRELRDSITTALKTSGGGGNSGQLDALVGLIGKLTEGNVALQQLVANQLQMQSGGQAAIQAAATKAFDGYAYDATPLIEKAPAKKRGRKPKANK